MARTKISADLKDWLNGFTAHIYNSYLGKTLKEAHNGAGSSHTRVSFVEDFLGASLETSNFTATVVKTAGTPTAALVSNAARGKVKLLLDSTVEVQSARIDFGDQLCFGINDKPFFETLFSFTRGGSTATYAVLGLASAHNATLATIAARAWLRISDTGSSISAILETDDGVNDIANIDAGVTIASGTEYLFKIDMSNKADVKFYINDQRLAPQKVFDMSNYSSNFQPYCRVGKAAVAATSNVTIDLVRVETDRV